MASALLDKKIILGAIMICSLMRQFLHEEIFRFWDRFKLEHCDNIFVFIFVNKNIQV